jgi:hypothetical protein
MNDNPGMAFPYIIVGGTFQDASEASTMLETGRPNMKLPHSSKPLRAARRPKKVALRAMARIQAIYRYPVKGLSAEQLPRTALTTGETVPGDRLYAIENGPSGFDPAMASYLAKQHFLMLMRNERLAKLRTIFEHSTHTLSLAREGRELARGDLRTQDGRATVERYFAEFCADELRGRRRSCMRPDLLPNFPPVIS